MKKVIDILSSEEISALPSWVKADIEKTIENRKLQDVILDVTVPMQNVMEEKADGEEKLVQKKLFPAYVLINMVMNDGVFPRSRTPWAYLGSENFDLERDRPVPQHR